MRREAKSLFCFGWAMLFSCPVLEVQEHFYILVLSVEHTSRPSLGVFTAVGMQPVLWR